MVVRFDASLCSKPGDNLPVWMEEKGRIIITPSHMLRQLAASSDPQQRMAVADHLNTPAEILWSLADDENADVRFAIAENHNITRLVLTKMLDDPNPYVAHRAQKTLSRLDIDEPCRLEPLLAQTA